MKTATAPLIALLAPGGPLVFTDVFTIALQGGVVLRYSGNDKMHTWGADTYLVGPIIKRSRISTVVGIRVDTMDMTITANDTIQVNGVPLLAFAAAGGLDGARVRVDKVFAPSWDKPLVGALLHFSGRVNDVDVSGYEANVTVNSDLEVLDIKVPRSLYQPGCVNTLYDSACQVNRAAVTVTGAVQASPTPTRFAFGTNLGAHATGRFDLGVLTFTSGANAGSSRTIKSFVSGGTNTITPIAPFPFTPAVSDAFTVYPGCDKTAATCTSKFSNGVRFRGFPFVPVPETIT